MYERLNNIINIDKLNSKNILLVGVGGVGSFCYEALIRSGIKNITIIDFDKYEISNLNRQLHSNLNTLDKYKVDVIKDYTSLIDKSIIVSTINEKLDTSSTIDVTKYDYVIDACDSISAKVLLAKACKENKIKFISSCGIGNRNNPELIKIMKLDDVKCDHLAKSFKDALRKENITTNIKVVASSEIPKKYIPVRSYMPVTAYAGLILADKVIKDLQND